MTREDREDLEALARHLADNARHATGQIMRLRGRRNRNSELGNAEYILTLNKTIAQRENKRDFYTRSAKALRRLLYGDVADQNSAGGSHEKADSG